ncbi:phosphate propanoyltransferase [Anaeromicropila populeti]|uniref:Phosphate propanoyltransferase n=1 Tax=Anaeromicropila populeti TaxID=37658 RepID=A0A1I6K978_9FIRM|nr:phosphate propanoyltransferase [Anaeromicropila populeti]SFR87430.1 putative phosphotransacetylase [Anaeromicropila populeti]
MVYYDITQEQLIQMVTEAVLLEIKKAGSNVVPTGISVRHIHLTREHVDYFFGRNYQLTPRKQLSQPGQFACEETLDLIGRKGSIKKVRILGPERNKSQVEVSITDARMLGIEAVLRSSGDVEGTPGITLRGPEGLLVLNEGVIVADRHIHMTSADARRFGVKDGQRVRVQVEGQKPGIMDGVVIRVSDRYRLDFHVDTDDGNAFMLSQGQLVTILK